MKIVKNKTKFLHKKIFTLIELLVVISIIAIIAGITISNLSDVRKKTTDTAIKAGMNQLRTHVELYYGNSDSYGNPTSDCFSGTDSNVFNTGQIVNIIRNIADNSLNNPSPNVDCYIPLSGSSWVMIARLRDGQRSCSTGQDQWWCADSTGASREVCFSSTGNPTPSCPQ